MGFSMNYYCYGGEFGVALGSSMMLVRLVWEGSGRLNSNYLAFSKLHF